LETCSACKNGALGLIWHPKRKLAMVELLLGLGFWVALWAVSTVWEQMFGPLAQPSGASRGPGLLGSIGIVMLLAVVTGAWGTFKNWGKTYWRCPKCGAVFPREEKGSK
jgi:hypothetical protein